MELVLEALAFSEVSSEYKAGWFDAQVATFKQLSGHITKMCKGKKLVLIIDEVDKTSNNRVFGRAWQAAISDLPETANQRTRRDECRIPTGTQVRSNAVLRQKDRKAVTFLPVKKYIYHDCRKNRNCGHRVSEKTRNALN